MTVCNMAIEAGARVGLVSVDEKTIGTLETALLRPEERTGVAQLRPGWTSLVIQTRTLIMKSS